MMSVGLEPPRHTDQLTCTAVLSPVSVIVVNVAD